MTLKEQALETFNLGFHVIPFNVDGKMKRPALNEEGGWKKYQKGQTAEDVSRLFTGNTKAKGFAVLTGINGLEVIDIDLKYAINPSDLYDQICQSVESLFDGVKVNQIFHVRKTPSGGYHWLFKTDLPDANHEIAKRPATKVEFQELNEEIRAFNKRQKLMKLHGKPHQPERILFKTPNDCPKVLIETRGHGGLIAFSESIGYSYVEGSRPLNNLMGLGENLRDRLENALLLFNEIYEEEDLSITDTEIKKQIVPDGTVAPWTDFNNQAGVNELQAMLERYGWKVDKTATNRKFIQLTRPGKRDGVSASIDRSTKFTRIFSTSSNIFQQKAYSPTALLARLEFNYNFSEVNKHLKQKGYGSDNFQIIGSTPTEEMDLGAFDIENMKEKRPSIMSVDLPDDETGEVITYPWLRYGQILTIAAKEKMGKTKLIRTLLRGMIRGMDELGFKFTASPEAVIYFDTEMDYEEYEDGQAKFHEMCGYEGKNIPNYRSYNLRDILSVEERWNYVERKLDAIKRRMGVRMVVIDGLMDMVLGDRGEQAAEQTLRRLMQLTTKYKCAVIPVMHFNEAGEMHGHTGKWLKRKLNQALTIIHEEDGEYDDTHFQIVNYLARGRKISPISVKRRAYDFVPVEVVEMQLNSTNTVPEDNGRMMKARPALDQEAIF